jgi:energy-coupling factor transporter ATP-binding protein EcfA2
MFTRLSVENFLSLKGVSLELGKVNILVGPNASGKSNVARALQLVAGLARGGAPYLEGYGRLRDLSFGFDPAVDIRVALEALVEGRRCEYVLRLTVTDYSEEVRADGEQIVYHSGSSSTAFIKGTTRILGLPMLGGPSYYGSVHGSVLAALPSDVGREVHRLASELKGISVHSFSPRDLRLRSHVTAEPALRYHGENLARYLLHAYLERRRDFQRVEEALRSLIPEVEEVVPHIEGDAVEVWIKAKGLGEPLRPHNVSDGTLRALAIASALYGGSSLVVLEEPENCVHPHLLEALMSLARDSPPQVIFTTHSPYLLDHARPEEVYVVEKEGLETKVGRLSAMKELEAVRRFLEEGGTLGEAWYSGMMGGTP